AAHGQAPLPPPTVPGWSAADPGPCRPLFVAPIMPRALDTMPGTPRAPEARPEAAPQTPATPETPTSTQTADNLDVSGFQGESGAAGGGGTFSGYIDSALPVTQIRLRYDSAYDDNRPDRAEFFYSQYRQQTITGAAGTPLYVG